MKISLSSHQFFDDEGRPLSSGRITVFLHDSDSPAELYTLEGDSYVAAENPVTCSEDGRVPTLFFEASVVDVKVEKPNMDGTYSLLDTYEDGFEIPSGVNATVLYGIESLHSASTSAVTVSVVGYDSDVYAPQRTYVWDPTCTELADDGVIVESDTTATGRWILLWEDEKLPCSVYGIRPGREANMAAFLTYPDLVGQWSIRTPAMPRLLSGNYTSNTTYTTARTLYFDDGAKFFNARFRCAAALVPVNSDYVADFEFTEGKARLAHSSWFRTASEFLGCGADTLMFDPENFYEDDTVTYPVTLDGKSAYFNGRLGVTFSGQGRITFSKCSLVGTRMFVASDAISFAHADVLDDWWASPQDVDWVNKVRALTAGLNTIRLENFRNVAAYVNALRANGTTELDLAGRSVYALDASGFTEVRNAVCGSLSIASTGLSVSLSNVKAAQASVNCTSLSISGGSVITFGLEPAVQALTVSGSTVHGLTAWTTPMPLNAMDSVVDLAIEFAFDNETDHAGIVLDGCTLGTGRNIFVKRLRMNGCRTDGNSIRIYPVKTGGVYTLHGSFTGNTFSSAQPLVFTKFDGLDLENAVYDCVLDWTFLGNRFIGNVAGISCRYWAGRGNGDLTHTFVKMSGEHSVVYSGNTGSCPGVDMRGVTIADNTYYVTEEVAGIGTMYKYQGAWKRVMPRVSPNWWTQDTVENHGTMVKYYSQAGDPLTYDLFFQVGWNNYFHDRDIESGDGDFFKLGVLVYGDYIRIVRQGSADLDTGVQARIV